MSQTVEVTATCGQVKVQITQEEAERALRELDQRQPIGGDRFICHDEVYRCVAIVVQDALHAYAETKYDEAEECQCCEDGDSQLLFYAITETTGLAVGFYDHDLEDITVL